MTAASTDEMKAAMRVQMRDAVARVRPFARAQRAEALESTVLRSPALVGARIVLAYRAMPDEIEVDGIVRTLAGRGVRVAFPRVSDHGTLQLLEIAARDPLDPALWTLDRYGIAAPNSGLLCARSGLVRALHPREIDAVIVPGRAFDRRGARLGRGKGFYDALLGRLRPDARRATIGVCLREQLVDCVPEAAHDRKVSVIAAERRLLRAAPMTVAVPVAVPVSMPVMGTSAVTNT